MINNQLPITNYQLPITKRIIFWFSLSLTFAVSYGILALKAAFSSEYVMQDDAREFVFWIPRFADPSLMPHDLIADYFKSVTPYGFTALYRLMSSLGIEPLLFSKLLPIVLGVITTVYCFGFCLQILPVPIAAFTSTLLMNQSLWLKDDIVSGSPRGFLYPLFFAFLYYLLRNSFLGVIVAIALLGLFYPSFVLVAVGVLIVRLWRWEGRKKGRSGKDFSYLSPVSDAINRISTRFSTPLLLCGAGIGAALLVTLPFAFSSSEFGPIVSAATARTLPEFDSEVGRIQFFNHNNPWKFWFQGINSGIRLSLNPPIIVVGFLLPFLLRYPARFPLVKQVNQKIVILPQILLASISLFIIAHALLFHLYVPSRYISHSLLIVMDIAGGMSLCILLDAALGAAKQSLQRRWTRFLAWGTTILVAVTLVLYPHIFWKDFARSAYFVGREPAVYKFFQQQPKDTLVASLTEEVNHLPAFAQRSILVGRKYAHPFHIGYYRQIHQRASDLIRAQYAPKIAEVQSFIKKYGVNFWLLEQSAFTSSYLDNDYFRLFQPAQSEARANLERSNTPALVRLMKRCSALETDKFVILPSKCIQNER